MKKIGFVLAAVVLCAGVVMASSLSLPFWVDLDSGANFDGYVGLYNNDVENDVDIAVEYFDLDGVDTTPEVNTFRLGANRGIGYQLFDLGDSTLDADGKEAPRPTSGRVGSAKYSWVGLPTQVQGRYVQLHPAGIYAFLLPPGS